MDAISLPEFVDCVTGFREKFGTQEQEELTDEELAHMGVEGF